MTEAERDLHRRTAKEGLRLEDHGVDLEQALGSEA